MKKRMAALHTRETQGGGAGTRIRAPPRVPAALHVRGNTNLRISDVAEGVENLLHGDNLACGLVHRFPHNAVGLVV